jgi:hypothetical protein
MLCHYLCDQCFCLGDIAHLVWGQNKAQWIAQSIDNCMNFCGQATARASAPFFSCHMLMGTDNGGVNNDVFEIRVISHGDK